jgi:hypothetical protein
MEPASIRYKNPGAMWGNALAKKWGSTDTVTLHDGLGQGNNIAVFPTYVQGICAQLDLWRTSPHYRNKRFSDAINIWDGHNHTPSYIAYVLARVPGMTPDTIMDDAFWRGPMGIGFLKAQAGHEAGKTYPAPDADWIEAQRRVFGGDNAGTMAAPVVKPAHKKTAIVIASAGTAGAAAQAAGGSHATVAIVVIVVAVIAIVGLVIHNKVSK